MKSKLLLIVISSLTIWGVFNIFVKNTAISLYCWRQLHVKIDNFKKSAFRLGVIHIDEEQKYINSIRNDIYRQCLTSP